MEDIKPYVDPTFANNVILTQTERLTMNSRPKDPKTARNKNVLVVGGSGSGKTRFFIKPNLMQLHSSYVVTDPKGSIVVECGKLLQRNQYKIKILNTINFKKSHHYNPFAYLHSEKDILKLVTTLIANTQGDGKSGDDFWRKAETLLYTALIGYIYYEAPVEEQNFATLIEMINTMEVREDDEDFKNPVDLMFEELAKREPHHFAVRQYAKYRLAAGKTAKSILISCGARLAPFDIQELREITAYDELELDTLGDRKTALFIIIPDTDDTFNFLASMGTPASVAMCAAWSFVCMPPVPNLLPAPQASRSISGVSLSTTGMSFAVGSLCGSAVNRPSMSAIAKASRRDLAVLCARGEDGATTVTTTMIIAHMAGIKVFATGGIGGVHRGAETTMDISADLEELASTPVMVVCAGAKSILDLGLTLEYLETHGVPVIGYGTKELPAFYTRKSGFSVDYEIDTPEELAKAFKTQHELGLRGGMLVTNPIPEEYSMDPDVINKAIDEAIEEAKAAGIHGKATTPFLLAKVKDLTGGNSLASNIQLVYNNAALAAGAGLRLEEAGECTALLLADDGALLACGTRSGKVLRQIAVSPEAEGGGACAEVVSALPLLSIYSV